jgi:cytoskeletal protein RodZ
MADNSQMHTPGEVLANARQKAGLSLDELATRTKIQQDMLQAIERDEYHKISGDLYVKSFMGSFAKEVGVEPEIVVDMYRDFSGETADGIPGASSNQWDEDAVEISSVGFPWLKLLAIVVVVACLVFAVSHFFFGGPEEETTASVEEIITEAPPEEIVTDDKMVDAIPQKVTLGDSSVKDEPDTLAVGWKDNPETMAEVVPEKAPLSTAVVPAITSVEDSASRILSTTGRGHLPSAFPGDQHVDFQGEGSWAVVLRLVCDEPVEFNIKRDAENDFSLASWPAGDAEGDPLPSENIVPGQAYAVRQGYAVYWGASDHFSLVLPDNKNMELSVNGVTRDLSRVKAGQEIIIDAPARNAGN